MIKTKIKEAIKKPFIWILAVIITLYNFWPSLYAIADEIVEIVNTSPEAIENEKSEEIIDIEEPTMSEETMPDITSKVVEVVEPVIEDKIV